MEILIISGFLGAGKTTFIQEMAKKTGRKFVIVENEFSELSIDGPLLTKEKSDVTPNFDVREISEGCICCSTNLDFSDSVLTIANSLDPDYLLVEPSGVAHPSRILRNLKRICYERIGLLAPITLVDGQHYEESWKKFPAYFEDQVQTARHLVISKSEGWTEEDFLRAKEKLGVGEETHFPTTHYSTWTKEDFFSLLHEQLIWDNDGYHFVKKEVKEEAPLENVVCQPFLLANPIEMMNIMHLLQSDRYGQIARAKGYGKSGEHWYRFDYVDGTYAITGCEKMEDTRAVVIGTNVWKAGIRALFEEGKVLQEEDWNKERKQAIVRNALKKRKFSF